MSSLKQSPTKSAKKGKKKEPQAPIDMSNIENLTADNAVVQHLQTLLHEAKTRLKSQTELESNFERTCRELDACNLARESLQREISEINRQRDQDAEAFKIDRDR